MPYDKISELPDSVKNNVPQEGQEIYKEAYNSAWDQYDKPSKPSKRSGDSSREETAHKVAWSAVKEKYKKEGDKWVRKDS